VYDTEVPLLSAVLTSMVMIPQEGALQPVIGLLSSKCTESQREAALLLGQFATTTDDYKAKIVQRGAVPPLIAMLGQGDTQVRGGAGSNSDPGCHVTDSSSARRKVSLVMSTWFFTSCGATSVCSFGRWQRLRWAASRRMQTTRPASCR
jgi:hypothetical protein